MHTCVGPGVHVCGYTNTHTLPQVHRREHTRTSTYARVRAHTHTGMAYPKAMAQVFLVGFTTGKTTLEFANVFERTQHQRRALRERESGTAGQQESENETANPSSLMCPVRARAQQSERAREQESERARERGRKSGTCREVKKERARTHGGRDGREPRGGPRQRRGPGGRRHPHHVCLQCCQRRRKACRKRWCCP